MAGEQRRNGLRLAAITLGAGLSLVLLTVGLLWHLPRRGAEPAAKPAAIAAAASPAAFVPPEEATIPKGPEGDAIRRGIRLFTQTGVAAHDYVGSSLVCSNCHLNAGRLANASPMWAAWGQYPAYRKKNNRINTMADRIRDCFLYSMNAPASPKGTPPPLDGDIYRDLQIYFAWLARGVPSGTDVAGRGYLKLAKTSLGHDPDRGATVYAANCAVCHGADGAGQANADGSYAVPPLWGPRSFNWGAGMSRLTNAAGFIRANMPLGEGGTLTDQQAWDVAAYVVSHERPRDPRQTGTIAAARAEFHDDGDYYGQVVRGDLLGDGVTH